MCSCAQAWTYKPTFSLNSIPSLFHPSILPSHTHFSSTKSHYWEFSSQAEFSRIPRLFHSIYVPLLLLVLMFILPLPFSLVFLGDFYSEKLSFSCCGICILLLSKRQKKIFTMLCYLSDFFRKGRGQCLKRIKRNKLG